MARAMTWLHGSSPKVRAGRALADLFSGGANTNYNVLYKGKVLDSIKDGLILTEEMDESKWYEGQHSYGDPEGKHIFIYIAKPTSSSLYFNTTLASLTNSRRTGILFNPRWQGKNVSQDPLSTGLGATMIFFYYRPELGPKIIKRLFGTMNITYGKDRRQITDWLVQGKFAICLGCRDAPRAKTQGLPVDEFDTGGWKEGESLSTGGGVDELDQRRTLHPNASKVFINWFLSRKGQIALQKHLDLYGELPPNSRRIDIPKEDLPPESRLRKGRKFWMFHVLHGRTWRRFSSWLRKSWPIEKRSRSKAEEKAMLTAEENELLTRVGPGTLAGELLRRYWHPVAIATDLSEENPVKFVRILGEDLVLFQSKKGELGLLADRCSHRGASLSYGRVKERGIACAYHGWLYDTKGNCLETLAEPPGSKFALNGQTYSLSGAKARGALLGLSWAATRADDTKIRYLGAHRRLALAARAAAARLQLAASDGKLRRYGASACAPSRAGH